MILFPLCRSLENVGFGRTHLLAESETLNAALRSLLSIYCAIYLYVSYIISTKLYSQEGHLPKGKQDHFCSMGRRVCSSITFPLSGNSFGGFSGCFGTYIYPWILVLFCFDKSIYLEIQRCLTNLIKSLLDSASCAGSPFSVGSVLRLGGPGGVWFPCTHSGNILKVGMQRNLPDALLIHRGSPLPICLWSA